MIKWLLCKVLGMHRSAIKDEWYPNIVAPIITEYKRTVRCDRCGTMRSVVHQVWDGDDFEDADPMKHDLKLKYDKPTED